MAGDETQVVHAFAAWLMAQRWTVHGEVDGCDLLAERHGRRLWVEAKGHTSSPGLDVDTAYGQLLRRMAKQDDPAVRYAVVVRDEPTSVRAVRISVRSMGCEGDIALSQPVTVPLPPAPGGDALP